MHTQKNLNGIPTPSQRSFQTLLKLTKKEIVTTKPVTAPQSNSAIHQFITTTQKRIAFRFHRRSCNQLINQVINPNTPEWIINKTQHLLKNAHK